MTAKEAFQLYLISTSANEDILNSIFFKIKTAAQDKKLGINIDTEIPESIKENLIELGYDVKYIPVPGFNEKKITFISWSNQIRVMLDDI